MANIAIILRTAVTPNWFQQAIVSAVGFPPFERALLCSGFFQEGSGGYLASNTLVNGSHFNARAAHMDLTVVGTYNSYGLHPFTAFIASVRAKTRPQYLTLRKRKTDRWHAKVFIAWESGVPAFAVIGSSNITRPAFDTTSPFNFECDVIIWNTSCPNAIALAEQLFKGKKVAQEVIFANYEENGRNEHFSVSDRLTVLAEEINNKSYEFE